MSYAAVNFADSSDMVSQTASGHGGGQRPRSRDWSAWCALDRFGTVTLLSPGPGNGKDTVQCNSSLLDIICEYRNALWHSVFRRVVSLINCQTWVFVTCGWVGLAGMD
jgi:hypothetical protein